MGEARGFEVLTTEAEWVRECHGIEYCPRLKCKECKVVVTSSRIHSMQRGQNIGCRCHLDMLNHWGHRRAEVVAMGEARDFEVLTTEAEWARECHGKEYCPRLKCKECKVVVTSTYIFNLQQGHNIGCKCNSTMLNHWHHRRSEVVQWGEARGFEVLTTEAEWVHECHGCEYCPKLKCKKCKVVVTSTCVSHLQQGQGLGCSCHNKTERKLLEWLQNKFAQARVTCQHPGPKLPGQTHFDFLLTFLDGLEVLIELDGPQHFWADERFYTGEGCERDLAKERWALGKGMSVVRVLQKDVWEDRFGWDQHILRSVGDSRKPRVFTYDAPEYTSTQSVYVQMRPNRERWMHIFGLNVL